MEKTTTVVYIYAGVNFNGGLYHRGYNVSLEIGYINIIGMPI